MTLLHGLSTELTIDPKVDLCVAEIIGSVAGAEGAAVVFADARERHMVEGGIVIPHRAETLVGGVCLHDALGGRAPAFTPGSVPLIERIFRSNGGPFDVRLRIQNVDASAVITSHAPVEINEFNGSLAASQSRRVRLTVRGPGRLDGLLGRTKLWFVEGGDGLNTLDVATNWATIFFPLFDEPIAVEPGRRDGRDLRRQRQRRRPTPRLPIRGGLVDEEGLLRRCARIGPSRVLLPCLRSLRKALSDVTFGGFSRPSGKIVRRRSQRDVHCSGVELWP